MRLGGKMNSEAAAPTDVLAFWRAAGAKKWFKKDASFDAEIRSRFLATYEAACADRLADWETTPEGALALLIVLDQFPRNMFRGDARTYAADPLARAVAGRAIAKGFDQRVPHSERGFCYLPFMHSEILADQEHCLRLSRQYADAEFAEFAEQHAGIVRRFGRFPHRNLMLGRATTPEEQAFLAGGGFAG
jgi:uncharacterized protein (DUF924 family)